MLLLKPLQPSLGRRFIKLVCIKSLFFLHMSPASQQEPVIYLITATYQRQSQKADLVSLCHTLKHVPSLVWIVVENSASQSPVIRAVLGRCNISAVHLTVQTPERIQAKKKYSPKVTGVVHRNTGLGWVREHCSRQDCGGVVLFGDDDDRYDLRLFDEVSYIWSAKTNEYAAFECT